MDKNIPSRSIYLATNGSGSRLLISFPEAVNGSDQGEETNQKGPMSADSNSSNATNGSGSRPDSNKA